MYHHGYAGYNFPKMIIKDSDTFFVELEYTAIDHSDQFARNYQAFVWEKIKTKDNDIVKV
jgi:hypothetical protein